MSFISERNLNIGDKFTLEGVTYLIESEKNCDNLCEGCSFKKGVGSPCLFLDFSGCSHLGCIFTKVKPTPTPHEVMSRVTLSVTKITDEDLLREACESTFNGKSKISLAKMYRSEHSPIRTQLFWVKFDNLPLFVSTHLLRHNVGSQPFALTHREDRKGGEDLGRLTPTKLSMLINAQSLIDMAKVRLCKQASKETVLAFKMIKDELKSIDIDLSNLLVPKCVYRNGLCGEMKPCGYNKTSKFNEDMAAYMALFV